VNIAPAGGKRDTDEPIGIRADPEGRPYHLRQAPPARSLPIGIAALLAVAAAGAGYWWLGRDAPPSASPQSPAVSPQPAPAAAPPAASHYPIPQDPAASLPTLDLSDGMVRAAIAGLIGSQAFGDLVHPSGIVRRFVATVDNLPRDAAPRRMFPVRSAPDGFRTTGSGEALAIGAANPARYALHLRALESLDSAALVGTYVRLYPLFQRAYEELGYPGRHFNDRLVECIDDLLAAPEVAPPVLLLQSKVLYEFADSQLETRSAGQKILMRMGTENTARVKAKLREIRRHLVAASGRKP
jgi:hypothetical protein